MNMTNDLISRKDLLESLLERMAGVYAEYHREIVQDELNDTIDLINTAPAIQQCGDGELAGFRFTHLDGSYELSFKPSEQKVAKEEKLFTYPPDKTAKIKALEGEIANLHTVMMAAAVEITEHWDAHCDAEGYGCTNLVRRLENGYPEQYGYDANTMVRMDTQIAELQEKLTLCQLHNKHLRFAVESLIDGADVSPIVDKYQFKLSEAVNAGRKLLLSTSLDTYQLDAVLDTEGDK